MWNKFKGVKTPSRSKVDYLILNNIIQKAYIYQNPQVTWIRNDQTKKKGRKKEIGKGKAKKVSSLKDTLSQVKHTLHCSISTDKTH